MIALKVLQVLPGGIPLFRLALEQRGFSFWCRHTASVIQIQPADAVAPGADGGPVR
jgi:hypothetical protein